MLTIKSVQDLEELPSNSEWLIRGLWPNQAFGMIAAEPKCGKTWLALELAVAVVSGERCLGEYPVESTGPVLFFNAEDPEHVQRDRLINVMNAKGLCFQDVADLKIIRSENFRLDQDPDLNSLRCQIKMIRPKLVILDPFVRLHDLNENNSRDVAWVLSRLRDIRRDFGTSVVLVHHQKKGGNSNSRRGAQMRGSSEFFAAGDAFLLLSKTRSGEVTMDVELRSAPSRTDIPIELISVNGGCHLQDVSPLPLAHVEESLPTMRTERSAK